MPPDELRHQRDVMEGCCDEAVEVAIRIRPPFVSAAPAANASSRARSQQQQHQQKRRSRSTPAQTADPAVHGLCMAPLPDGRSIHVDSPSTCAAGVSNLTHSSTGKVLRFDRVFQSGLHADAEAENDTLYESSVRRVISATASGYNSTVLAYGQTGSGKTHTLSAITPRALRQVFAEIAETPEGVGEMGHTTHRIAVSYLEIYNERLRDLLHGKGVHHQHAHHEDPMADAFGEMGDAGVGAFDEDPHDEAQEVRRASAGGAPPPGACVIREGRHREIQVVGMSINPVGSAAEAWELVRQGEASRHVATTKMNSASSRSHTILTIYVMREGTHGAARCSKAHLVDLAGSERNKRTGNTGLRLKESVSINTGLLALGNVISALAKGGGIHPASAGHIPFRGSKLTRLLQDALGGDSKTVFIACLSPCTVDHEESLSTLAYAARAKSIVNRPSIAPYQVDAFKRQMVAGLACFGHARMRSGEEEEEEDEEEEHNPPTPPPPAARHARREPLHPLEGNCVGRQQQGETHAAPACTSDALRREHLIAEVSRRQAGLAAVRDAISASPEGAAGAVGADVEDFHNQIGNLKLMVAELGQLDRRMRTFGEMPSPATAHATATTHPTREETERQHSAAIAELTRELQEERARREEVEKRLAEAQQQQQQQQQQGGGGDAAEVVQLQQQVAQLRSELSADEGIFAEYLAENRRLKRQALQSAEGGGAGHHQQQHNQAYSDTATNTSGSLWPAGPERSVTPDNPPLGGGAGAEVAASYCPATHTIVALAELAGLQGRERRLEELAKENYYFQRDNRKLKARAAELEKRFAQAEADLRQAAGERDAMKAAVERGCGPALGGSTVIVTRDTSGLRKATLEEILDKQRARRAQQQEGSPGGGGGVGGSHVSASPCLSAGGNSSSGGGSYASGSREPPRGGRGGGGGGIAVSPVPEATPSFAAWSPRSHTSYTPNYTSPGT